MGFAVAALIVSGGTLLWTIGWSVYTHRHSTRARVTVRQSLGAGVYDLPGGGSRLGDTAIVLNATNTGLSTVTLSGVQLVIRRAGGGSIVPFEWITQSPSPLPIRLGPGDTWVGMIHAASVKEGIDRQRGQGPRWQVRAVMSDGADRRFPAKPRGWSRLRPGRRWIAL